MFRSVYSFQYLYINSTQLYTHETPDDFLEITSVTSLCRVCVELR